MESYKCVVYDEKNKRKIIITIRNDFIWKNEDILNKIWILTKQLLIFIYRIK